MIPKYNDIHIKTARSFTLILMFLIIIYQGIQYIRGLELKTIPFLLLFILIVVYSFFPRLVKGMFWFFSSITGIIGTLLSYLILTLVFFLLIFPLGTLRKLLGRSPITLSFDPSVKSYWHDQQSVKNDMKKQY